MARTNHSLIGIHFVALTMAVLFAPLAGYAHIQVDYPLGGEEFTAGEEVEILWDAYIWHGPGTVDVEFSSNNGVDYTPIELGIPIENEITDHAGATMWIVPDVNSDECRIKVTQRASATYTGTTPPFTIGTAPDEGEGEEPGPYPVMEIAPSKDNTLYEDVTGSVSNGAGQYLFFGLTDDGFSRRGLLHFDISGSLPPGSTIMSASVMVNVSKVPPGASSSEATLHRLSADWGEGASAASGQEGQGAAALAGDATWLHTFSPDGFWTSEGGDFSETASASVEVSGLGTYTWESTEGLLADVRLWMDEPGSNAGWLILGDESGSRTARRIDSRENSLESQRPVLRIEYMPSGGGITSNLSPGFISEGQYLELSAPEGGVDYQWYKDGEPMENDPEDPPRVFGSQSSILAFDPVMLEDAGAYTCEYDDGSKALVVTDPFLLEVLPPGSLPVADGLGLALLAGLLTVAALGRRRLISHAVKVRRR